MSCFSLAQLTQRQDMQLFPLERRLSAMALKERHSQVLMWVGRKLIWCQGPLRSGERLTNWLVVWSRISKRDNPSLSTWPWVFQSLVLTWLSLRLSHRGFSKCYDALRIKEEASLPETLLLLLALLYISVRILGENAQHTELGFLKIFNKGTIDREPTMMLNHSESCNGGSIF